YRIVLDTPPPFDVLPVEVELAAGASGGDGLGQAVEQAMKQTLGATARVTVLAHGSLPVTEGKTKRVIRTYQ
ncbi:MAG: hypothetical protein R3287_14605, partial [Anderseniella sp.]|nr:hypothetical protein [Anderseniella sp.]